VVTSHQLRSGSVKSFQQVTRSQLLTGSVRRYSVRALQLALALGLRWRRYSARSGRRDENDQGRSV
jgi:hypothetical protein